MNIKSPKLIASFVLGSNGEPEKIESKNHNHYKLRLSVKDAPDDTYAVTYYLHPAYYDPVREARNKEVDFAEELTSYGDYEVQAKIRSQEYPLPVRRNLYEALAETYADITEPSILEALNDIKEN
ncbi:pYEATS domain-containing protein [Nitrosomonas sp. Nm34]|uniref:pYEATS domain-containing protein n=1 Tax=Nitrosomonas sp. Nm34 TaxID=1881055 RepID=UPI0008EFA7C2|nr:pYEATS domain-containing protein [Nitrosomonas sp. Nm34]SFI70911.1 hypothetical protein SAMN05428978_102834 [Nitrosomonas sp. Nm34]